MDIEKETVEFFRVNLHKAGLCIFHFNPYIDSKYFIGYNKLASLQGLEFKNADIETYKVDSYFLREGL